MVEVVVGYVADSLALLADAGHMLADVGALTLALVAAWLARAARDPERSFGYRRAEILAALANGVVLVAIAIWIFVEALQRSATRSSPRRLGARRRRRRASPSTSAPQRSCTGAAPRA